MGKKDFSKSQIGRFMESTNEPIEENTIAYGSSADAEQIEEKVQQANTLRIAKKKKEETKSKRVNLLIKPSLYSKANKQAKKLGYKSFNDFINSILEQIVEGE